MCGQPPSLSCGRRPGSPVRPAGSRTAGQCADPMRLPARRRPHAPAILCQHIYDVRGAYRRPAHLLVTHGVLARAEWPPVRLRASTRALVGGCALYSGGATTDDSGQVVR
jgi:hypothetical protein